MVEQIISWISTGKHRDKGISVLEQLSSENVLQVWDKHFTKIAYVIISMLSDEDITLRDDMDNVFNIIIENQDTYFTSKTKDICHFFIQSFREIDLSICFCFAETIAKLCEVLDPVTSLEVIIKYLQKDQANSIIFVSLLLLKNLSHRLNKEMLVPHIEEILDNFVVFINSSVTQIKMNVIMCISGFYKPMGNGFEEEYLQSKFQSKISIIKKYIK